MWRRASALRSRYATLDRLIIPAPARLLAAHRARESERPNALFRDPYARPLLGAIDAPVARVLSGGDATEWLFAARTRAFDRLIVKAAAGGVSLNSRTSGGAPRSSA